MSGFGDLSVAAFSDALAADTATPGGGSASAVAGSLAASLVAMVASMSDGLAEIAAEAESARAELLALADEDARAFDLVMAAFRLPKATEAEKAARSAAIQEGYKAATVPPARLCAGALRVLELAAETAERGNPNAVSDAGVAALLAAAAVEGAALNVLINTGSIKDEPFRREHEHAARAARDAARALRERAVARVDSTLG